MVKEFKERCNIIWKRLREITGIRCVRPKGAFYIYPNVTEACHNLHLKDSKELQEYLLYEADVAVPGRNCFGSRNEGEKDEYMRLSYATSKGDILEGLRRIKRAVEE